MRTVQLLSTLSLAIVVAHDLPAQRHAASPQAIARAVDSLATRAVAADVTPALGVAITMDGRTVFSKAYGWADATNRVPANERTLWYVASTSKSFTGFGASLLDTQGVFSLDDPIGDLLPGVTWPSYVNPNTLSLARFLAHAHGMNDNVVQLSAAFTGAIPESRWPDLIRYAPARGTDAIVYSNFGYNVAAMVIDRYRREGWRRFLDSAVYAPVGMTETYTRVSGLDTRRIAKPHEITATGAFATSTFDKADATMNSAGGHLATLHDLARWTIVQMDSGRIDGRQVFSAAAVARSHRLIAPHTVESSKRFGPFDREGWGAGWDIGAYRGERMVSRFGSYANTRSHLSFLPARRIGFVGAVTGPGASSLTDILATLAFDLEVGHANAIASASARVDSLVARRQLAGQQVASFDSVRAARQRVPLKHPLADFAGAYASDEAGTLTFTLTNGALRFQWGVLQGPVEIFDAARDAMRFEVGGTGTVAAFAFDGAGPARAIEVMGMRMTRK